MLRFGLIISSVVHAVVLLWALLHVHSAKPLDLPKPEPIVTEIITPGELAKLRKGARTAKLDDAQAREAPDTQQPKKEAPKPRVVTPPPPPPPAPPPPAPKEEPKPPEPAAAPPPPPPPPAKVEAPPPPVPVPEPDKQALEQKLEELAMQKAAEDKQRAEAEARAKAEADAKAKAEAEAKARAEEEARAKAEADAKAKAIAKAKAEARAKAKAEAKARADAKAKSEAEAKAKEKSKIDSDRLAALLDKTPDQKQAAPAAPTPETPTKAKGPVKGASEGRDRVNAVNEASMLLGMVVNRVKTCWNIQAGGEMASSQVPRIQFDLNRDGSLHGEPRVVNPQRSAHFQLAADAALRAVINCQNYELPADKYDMWKRVTLDFDPREMFR